MHFRYKLWENIITSFFIDILSFIIFWLLFLLIKTCINTIKCILWIYLFHSGTFFWPFRFNTHYKVNQSVKWIWCNILCITFTIINLSSFRSASSAILRCWFDNLSGCLYYRWSTLPLCLVLICVKRAG